MPDYGEVSSPLEIRRINRATGEIENWYRYTVTTPKGTIFTETVPEKVALSDELDKVLRAKAEKLDRLTR